MRVAFRHTGAIYCGLSDGRPTKAPWGALVLANVTVPFFFVFSPTSSHESNSESSGAAKQLCGHGREGRQERRDVHNEILLFRFRNAALAWPPWR